MNASRALTLLLFPLTVAIGHAGAQGFSFSQDEQNARRNEQREAAEREDRIAQDLSVPCRAELKNKKIMVIIGERQSNGHIEAHQQNYGRLYQAIN
jgi:hypothetical protein